MDKTTGRIVVKVEFACAICCGDASVAILRVAGRPAIAVEPLDPAFWDVFREEKGGRR